MTRSTTARTELTSPADAGVSLGSQILEMLGAEPPDVVILFASPAYDYERLLESVERSCRPGLLVGCSSAGEFTDSGLSTTSACAIALRAPDVRFRAGLGRNLRTDRSGAVRQVLASFRGMQTAEFPYRAALILADALAGYTEDLVDQLTIQTAGQYQFFGGGAGDDARFSRTHVFLGSEAFTDAVVALEILSTKPIGIGVGHGWQPATSPLRVTESGAARVVSLNAAPAAEVYSEYAAESGEPFPVAQPLPFFLHHVLGISTPQGFKLRVPLSVNDDQSISCASDVPEGAAVSIMSTSDDASADAAGRAARAALSQLGALKPAAALFFDCAATRLRMGRRFGREIEEVGRILGTTPFAGCNTYGQIARADGQFSGFHNCTAVVCVLPE